MTGFNPSTWPTFQQSNPWIQGVNAGQGLYRNYLQNKYQQEVNQGKQFDNDHAGESFNLKKFLANIREQEAINMVNNQALQYWKGGTQQANAAARLLNTPGTKEALAINPGLAQNAAQGTAGFIHTFGSAQNGGSISNTGNPANQSTPFIDYFGNYQNRLNGHPVDPHPTHPQQVVQLNQPQQSNQNINQKPNTLPVSTGRGAPPISDNGEYIYASPGTPQITNDQVKKIQNVNQDMVLQSTTPAPIQLQRYADKNLKTTEDAVNKDLPLIREYLGLGGIVNRTFSNIGSQFGHSSPEYTAWRNLPGDLQNYDNEVRRLTGTTATDQEQKNLRDLTNPSLFESADVYINKIRNHMATLNKVGEDQKLSLSQVSQSNSPAASLSPSQSRTQGDAGTSQLQVIHSLPAGSVELIDSQGRSRIFQKDQIKGVKLPKGWRLANG